MLKRKMLTATLLAVGTFISLDYTSLAQTNPPTTAPSPGATEPSPSTTAPSPGATELNPGTTQPNPGSTPLSPGTTGPDQTSLSASDTQFINQAAQGGMAEVELGQLALKQASSKAVKKYAQQMINEHTKVNNELMALATQKGVTPPTTIGAKYEAVRAKLSKLSGKNFDQAYMKQAGIQAHTEQAALFQRQAQQGQDPQLKAFAAKTLPAVQKHLQEAQAMTGTKPSASSSYMKH